MGVSPVRRASTGAVVALAIASLALASCGDDEDAGGETTAQELVDRLPEGETADVIAADLAVLRQGFDLPPDADPDELLDSDDLEERTFALHAATGLKHLVTPRDNPVRQAIDAGRITAYAGHAHYGDESVTVVATDQSYDEVAGALEERGYRRFGEVVGDDSFKAEIGYPVVADGGDGTIILGQTLDPVEAAAGGYADTGTGLERELLGELDAPLRAAFATGAGRCLEGMAIGESPAERTGRAIVQIAGEADPGRFVSSDPSLSFSGIRFERPRVEGSRLEIALTTKPDIPAEINPLNLFLSELSAGAIYDCP